MSITQESIYQNFSKLTPAAQRNGKEPIGSEQHLFDLADPVADSDESEPGLHTPDTINIPQMVILTDDA
jgi:hypothetical protein